MSNGNNMLHYTCGSSREYLTKTSSPTSYSFIRNTTMLRWCRITFTKNSIFSRVPATGGNVLMYGCFRALMLPTPKVEHEFPLGLITASEIVKESSERKHVRVSISLSVSSSTIMRYCILQMSKLPSPSSKLKNRTDTWLSELTVARGPEVVGLLPWMLVAGNHLRWILKAKEYNDL